ncbi:hypothetical protein [Vibrio parahaemolyticus]|uniref:hypothetical protein n=1 Tax=Vibrio parahaemolyticus TaxID=670 RepID=UPI00226B97E6|nr:hypothetical protein [Vibrio parahaemolyticus]MCX8816700.1 hypothetical protein [Vibrio parahaemolyticus]
MTPEIAGAIAVAYILLFYAMVTLDVYKLVFDKTQNKRGSVLFAALFPVGFLITGLVYFFKGIRGS